MLEVLNGNDIFMGFLLGFFPCHFCCSLKKSNQFRCRQEGQSSPAIFGILAFSGCKIKRKYMVFKCSHNEQKWIIEENNVRVSDLCRLNVEKNAIKCNSMPSWNKKEAKSHSEFIIGNLLDSYEWLYLFINEITMYLVQSQSSFALFVHNAGG